MRYNPCFVMAVLVTILGQVSGAEAQTSEAKKSPVIAVIDFQYITRNSLAGKAVRKQVNAQHQTFQNEIAKLQSELEGERQELRKLQELEQSAQLIERRRFFQIRTEELQALVQKRKQQIDQMYIEGVRRVEIEMARVIQEIASDFGIDIILNAARGQGIVLYANQSTMITDEITRRLDVRLPTVRIAPPSTEVGSTTKPSMRLERPKE